MFVGCSFDLSRERSLRVSDHNKLWINFTTTSTQSITHELLLKLPSTEASQDLEPSLINKLGKACSLYHVKEASRSKWCLAISMEAANRSYRQDTSRSNNN